MPSEVSSRISDFLQSVARLARRRAQETSGRGSTGAAEASSAADRVDLTSNRNLPPAVASAARHARDAHSRSEHARSAADVIGRLRALLERIREQLRESSGSELADPEPLDVQEQLDEIQSELSDAARQIPGGSVPSDQPTSAPDSGDTVTTAQVTVTGTGAGSGGIVREDAVAMIASEVARDAGLTGVRFAEADADSVFRFTDSGNGFITVTRYNREGDDLVESGSQTVALRNFRNGGMADGSSESLKFDRLGLDVDIGQDYTPGDLNQVDVRVQTPADSGAEVSVSRIDASTVDTRAAAGVSVSPDVTRRLAALIDLADTLTAEARAAEQYAVNDIRLALSEIAAAGPAELGIDSATLERQLRAAFLGN